MPAASCELIPSHSTSRNACRCPIGSEAIASANSSPPPGPGRLARRGLDGHGKQPPSPDGQVPQALPVQVHGGAIDIACWRVHDPDPVPALIDPGHRRLREFLGLVLVAGEQVQGSDQARVLGLEEGLEAQGLRHVPQGRPSHPMHLRLRRHCDNP